VWPHRRFKTGGSSFARRRCGLHAWKTVRAIRILHYAYQLSAVRDRSTAFDPSVWNPLAFGVLSHLEIIDAQRHDGDWGLPSHPVGHRSMEHVPPPSQAASPQQNEVSVLFLGDPDNFVNRSAHGHHRVDASPIAWWNQGVELPARFLTEVAASELLIEPRPQVLSAQIDHVAEEEGEPADCITADRRPLDHVEEESDTSHRSGQVNARPDRCQGRFGEIRGH
jgi:hypothetical protein